MFGKTIATFNGPVTVVWSFTGSPGTTPLPAPVTITWVDDRTVTPAGCEAPNVAPPPASIRTLSAPLIVWPTLMTWRLSPAWRNVADTKPLPVTCERAELPPWTTLVTPAYEGAFVTVTLFAPGLVVPVTGSMPLLKGAS